MARLNASAALLLCLFAASWLFAAAQPRAKTTYIAANVCCRGCSLEPAGCCCSPVKAPKTITKTVKKTATVKQTVVVKKTTTLTSTVGGGAVRRRLEVDLAENTRVGDLIDDSIGLEKRRAERASENVELGQSSLEETSEPPRSGLFKRHVCPLSCPKGVKVLASSDSKHNTGGSVVYCCPVRKTLTKTITQKSTKKVTVKKTTTIKVTKSVTQTATTTKPNKVVAIVFSDVNGNGNNGPGDAPLPNVPVDLILAPATARQKRALCTVLDSKITGPDGTVSFEFDLVSANAQLCIVKHGQCTPCLVPLTANANGQVVTNGTVEVPIPVTSTTVSLTKSATQTKSLTKTQTLTTTSFTRSTSFTATTSCTPPPSQFQGDSWPLFTSGNGEQGIEWLTVETANDIGNNIYYVGSYKGAGVKIGGTVLPDSGSYRAGVFAQISCTSSVPFLITSTSAVGGDTVFTGVSRVYTGDPVIVGWTEASTVTVGNKTISKGVGTRDSFVAQLFLNTASVIQFSMLGGSAAGDMVTLTSVWASGYGNFFVYGSWKAPGGIFLAGSSRASYGGVDCLVGKFDGSTWTWGHVLGSSGDDLCASKISMMDGDCNVIVGGGFTGPTLEIDDTLSPAQAEVNKTNSNSGTLDAFVVVLYTSGGSVSHIRTIGGPSASDQVVTATAYDTPTSMIWVGGYFNQSVGDAVASTSNSRSDYDMFFARLGTINANLTTAWFDSIGGRGDDRVSAFSTLANSFVFFAGNGASQNLTIPGLGVADYPLYPGIVDDTQSYLLTGVIDTSTNYPTIPSYIAALSAGEFTDEPLNAGEFNKINDIFAYYESGAVTGHQYPVFYAGSSQHSFDRCKTVNVTNSGMTVRGVPSNDLFAFRLDFDTSTSAFTPPTSGFCPPP